MASSRNGPASTSAYSSRRLVCATPARLWPATSQPALFRVIDGILVVSQPEPSDVCVDLGAGTGFVSTALAPLVASVHAVDISPAMTVCP
jgi:methylase of polypeptide subunit release factors